MIDYTFKNAALRLNARFKSATVARHWSKVVQILSTKRLRREEYLAAMKVANKRQRNQEACRNAY